jgi:hypothetical protein
VYAPTVTGRPGEAHLRTRMGVSLQAGGGVINFAGEAAREVVSSGGVWEARVVFGTRSVLAVEGAYVGSARAMDDDIGANSNATLFSHGVEGAFRLNLPFAAGGALFEPFAFAGAGWARFAIVNGGTLASGTPVSTVDNVVTVPFGVGTALGYHGFLAEARFTYRGTFEDDVLILTADGDHASLQTWAATLQLGFEF